MDFFQRQDHARKVSRRLIFFFFLAVAATIAAVYLGIALGRQAYGAQNSPSLQSLWDPGLFLIVTASTLAIVVGGSAYKISTLSSGGSAVASALGGRPLNPSTTDPAEVQLRNVIEEMAIASGVPVPEIFILDGEPGINAFAAGNSTSDAAIGVTRGAMTLLDRDELQAVMGHEFSHILNGDMRLNLRLLGWIHGILCLAIIGRILLRSSSRGSRRRNQKGGNPLPALGLLLLVVGYIGVFFGRLIKSAVSRQREFLADAAAVQFTRYPPGLVGAFKKIGGLAYGSKLVTPAAEEASHMFFGNGLNKSWFNLMATHPPLEERIRQWEPNFDGRFPAVRSVETKPEKVSTTLPSTPAAPAAKPKPIKPPTVDQLLFPGQKVIKLPPSHFAEQAGNPTPAHLAYASALIAHLPEEIIEASHDALGATALVYALQLSASDNPEEAATAVLHGNPAIWQAMKLLPATASLENGQRLPVVEMALPALRRLSAQQHESFSRNLKALVAFDRKVNLFEYALQKMLFHHLEPHFRRMPIPAITRHTLHGLETECSVLLSLLARLGHSDDTDAIAAFRAGAGKLNSSITVTLLDAKECTLAALDHALNQLTTIAPQCKKVLLDACAETVAADGVVHFVESELLRAIADTLGCPIPPLIAS